MDSELQLLVVEDDPLDAKAVRRLLIKGGVLPKSDVAGTLAEAKEMLRLRHYDAVILDLGLPDSQGVDSVIDFQASAPELPIVVLTGAQDEAAALRAVDIGAEDYISKDALQPESLLKALRFAVERHRRKRELFRDMDSLRLSLEEALRQAAPDEEAEEGAPAAPPRQEGMRVRLLQPLGRDGATGFHLSFSSAPLDLDPLRDWRHRNPLEGELHVDLEASSLKPALCGELGAVFRRAEERASCVLFVGAALAAGGGGCLGDLRLLRQAGFKLGLRGWGCGASNFDALLAIRPDWLRLDPALTLQAGRYREKEAELSLVVEMLRPLGARLAAEEAYPEDLRLLERLGLACSYEQALLRQPQ